MPSAPLSQPTESLSRATLSLARTQLLAQSQLGITLDAQALGTMGFDVAFGAIVVNAKAHAYVWLVSLAFLVVSVFYAGLSLLTAGAEQTGPAVNNVLDRRGGWSDEEIERQVVNDLGADLTVNTDNLEAKADSVQFALAMLLLALAIELLGQI